MQNSGTKLVITLVGLALILGGISWWYRYETARRSTQFWGSEAAQLIAESKGFELLSTEEVEQVLTLGGTDMVTKVTDLSKARGQAHLRHAFLSDRNYVWDPPLDGSSIEWRWTLRFFEGDRQTFVILSGDLQAIGKYDFATDTLFAYSCQPMTKSLEPYFKALGLLAKPQANASTATE